MVSTATPTADTVAQQQQPAWGEWIIAGALFVLGIVIVSDGVTQRASTSASGIGAGFMPTVVGGGLILLTIALFVQLARGKRGEAEQAEGDVDVSTTQWVPMLVTLGALLVFIATVEWLGYLITSTVVFWLIAWAMGARRHLVSLLIAAAVSAVIYFSFTRLLTINLPGGLLEGII